MSLNNLYFGTWQFGGDFTKLSENSITELILKATKVGITRFDTARVYGGGSVEKLLGYHFGQRSDIRVVTKIPAVMKPPLLTSTNSNDFYPLNVLEEEVWKSVNNLGTCLDSILLHNWSPYWIDSRLIQQLRQIVPNNIRIGISLPNRYPGKIDTIPMNRIDVLELPHNKDETWFSHNLSKLRQIQDTEILVRSLFRQGIDTKTSQEIESLDPRDKRSRFTFNQIHSKVNMKKAISVIIKYGFSCVIGMTSKKQILQNVSSFK